VILSTVLRPPKAPPTGKNPKAKAPRSGALEAYRRRSRRYDRVIFIGVGASVIVHLLFVFMSGLIVGYLEPNYSVLPAAQPRRIREEGTQVVDIRLTENVEVVPQRTPQPEPEPEVVQPIEVIDPVIVGTVAERLRPQLGDIRLRLIPSLFLPNIDMTTEERTAELRARLYAMIEAYDDSIAALLAAEAEAMDWTVGEEGNKWGVSPGQIHLGPITLPLPFYFGGTREQAEQAGEWAVIQQQAGQGAADEAFDERVRAIRERREQEAKRDTTSGGGG
jgi:hypothetical protein